MGASAGFQDVLEVAYWDILRKRSDSKWNETTPYLNGGGSIIDLSKCAEALREFSVLDAYASAIAHESFHRLVYLASGSAVGRVDPEIRSKLDTFRLGTFLRCAAFVALARGTGVYEMRQADLEMATIEAVLA